MRPERWKQVDELFSAVLSLDPDKRAAFLDDACAGDEALRREVQTLLASDGQKDSAIEAPVLQAAAEFFTDLPPRLSPGDAIGPYTIVSLLGAGGMGEVYRAEDPRIGREVAIKILPPRYSQDPDRIRRFEQEARAAGLLNHPNILAIYDAGMEKGSPYLVSELLQGELLRNKLKGSPLTLRKAVDYALQIANGLSAAHERGIVHRDLKPENIFITKESRAKILDFGLAKLIHPEVSAPVEAAVPQTETGVVVGTVVYMSPEQVRGAKVDHRSDIFAFGAMLYEMLTGKRPFQGESQIEVMHAILKSDPPALSQGGANIPLSLERIVQRCLEKVPDHRFQSMSDLAFALESLSSASGTSGAVARVKTPVPLVWVLSALFLVATLILASLFIRSRPAARPQSPPDVQRLSIVLPEDSVLNSMDISPDGRRLAYVVNGSTGFSKLWLRSLDSTQSEEIPGTEDATFPFWSPDSRSIAFFTRSELKKVTIGGGPPQSLCEVDVPKGGAWNQDGVIVFARTNVGGLYRISSEGGEPIPVTTLDPSRVETYHRFPRFLPDGRHFFYIVGSSEAAYEGLYIGSLDSKVKKRLFPETTPAQYIDPGYGIFERNGKLMVQPFDIKRLEFTGEATPVAENVESGSTSGPVFSASKSSILVYGNTGGWESQPAWFDRSGKPFIPPENQRSTLGEPGDYDFLDMSSDEKRLLLNHNGETWMVDLLTDSFIRFAMTNDNATIFSPDGSHVAYLEPATVGTNLYQRLSSGTGEAELLFHWISHIQNLNWSPDGKFILCSVYHPGTKYDEWVLPLSGERKPFAYLQTEAREQGASFSPDGKWIAYESDETGRPEIYVRSFPMDAAARWQISTVGAQQPKWRRDGKELFYLTLDKKLMATEVETGQTFKPGTSRLLFQTHSEPVINPHGIMSEIQYFAADNGQHFLINTLIPNKTQVEITVMLNWKTLLKEQ